MQPVLVVRGKAIAGVTIPAGCTAKRVTVITLLNETLARLCLVFPVRDIGRRRRDYGLPTLSRSDGM